LALMVSPSGGFAVNFVKTGALLATGAPRFGLTQKPITPAATMSKAAAADTRRSVTLRPSLPVPG